MKMANYLKRPQKEIKSRRSSNRYSPKREWSRFERNREFQARSEKRNQKMFKVVTHPNLKRGHKKTNFEIVSFFQNRNRQTSQSKKKECAINKIVAGVAATSTHCRLSEALRWTYAANRSRGGKSAHPRRHYTPLTQTYTRDTRRRRSRRRERETRGNGGPFHTPKELRLEKGQSTSKLLRSQVTKSRRLTIKLTYGPAYISVHTFFSFQVCRRCSSTSHLGPGSTSKTFQ